MAGTGYYFLDYPPVLGQYGTKRRNGASLSGVLELHSSESSPDWVGPDTGAEILARLLSRRTDRFASYTACIDSDSIIKTVPWLYETWHDVHTNNHAIGFAFATQASKWNAAPLNWRNLAVRRMAEATADAAKYVQNTRGIEVPARFLTRSEAHARKPGFVLHGVSDPGRRSDPWVNSPMRAQLEEQFLEEYAAAMGQTARPVITLLPEPVVSPGRKNAYAKHTYNKGEVKRIQNALAFAGYYKGRLDDDYGRMTFNAVRAYQSLQMYWPGKIVDGDWWQKTQAHYDWVKTLQKNLNQWESVQSIGKLRIDGDYGTLVNRAVNVTMVRNRGRAYRGIPDNIPGPVFCKMLGIPSHP